MWVPHGWTKTLTSPVAPPHHPRPAPPKQALRGPGARVAARTVACAAALGAARSARATSAWFPLASSREGLVCIAPVPSPPARSEAEESHREAVEQLLSNLWRDRTGYGISPMEEDIIALAGNPALPPRSLAQPGTRSSTYGEVTAVGLRQIGRSLGTDALTADERMVFMDMGSGVGKAVVQAHLEWPAVEISIGVELSKTRSQQAQDAWADVVKSGDAQEFRERALSLLPSPAGELLKKTPEEAVHFIQGDLFEVDMSKVTHAYVASLCFGDIMLRRLARKISEDAPNLRVLGTLRLFPDGLTGFVLDGHVQAQMSWTKHGGGQTVHIYRRAAEATTKQQSQ